MSQLGQANSAPAYWMSHSVWETHGVLPQNGDHSFISIVLDAGVQHEFSGIRVLVVCRESTGFGGITIEDCPYATKCGIKSDTRPLNHRRILSSIRKQKMNQCILHENELGRGGTLCTIVFELSKVSPYLQVRSTMNLLPQSTAQRRTPLRILYENIQPAHRRAFVLFIHNSRNLCALFDPHLAGYNSYTVRVLPVSRDRPPFRHLPLRVLRRIVWHIFEQKHKGWRKALLLLGMVCKAWAPVLDLYFGDLLLPLRLTPDDDPADAIDVACSLERNPSRGRLIKRYDPCDYSQSRNMASLDYSRAQITMLQLTTSLHDIYLNDVHKSMVHELIQTLRGLRQIQYLNITGRCHPHPRSVAHRLSIDEISMFAVQWPRLRRLVLCGWRTSKSAAFKTHLLGSILSFLSEGGSRNGARSKVEQLTCHLEDLALDSGELTRSQLLFFTAPSHPLPSLQKVSLQRIKGLTNSDFLVFLNRVASTLQFLTVSCKITRAPGEEYALDAAMPNMVCLNTVHLHGDLASESAISRKKASLPRHGRETSISFRCNYLEMSRVLKALDDSGWHAVHVVWDHTISPPLPHWIESAYRVAGSRGIRFSSTVRSRFTCECHQY